MRWSSIGVAGCLFASAHGSIAGSMKAAFPLYAGASDAFIWSIGNGEWNLSEPNWKKSSDGTLIPFANGSPAQFQTDGNLQVQVASDVKAGKITVAGQGTVTLSDEKIGGDAPVEKLGSGKLIMSGSGFGPRKVTVSGGSLQFTETDIQGKELCIKGGGDVFFSGSNKVDFSDGIILDNGGKLNCDYPEANPLIIANPVIARGNEKNHLSMDGAIRYTNTVQVELGNILAIDGYRQNFDRGVSGDTVQILGGNNYFGPLEAEGTFSLPENLILDGGDLSIVGRGTNVFKNVTISRSEGCEGRFWPAFNYDSQLTTIFEKCSFDLHIFEMSTENGGGTTILRDGTNVKLDVLKYSDYSGGRAATIHVEDGASLEVSDRIFVIDHDTLHKQQLIIDGGTVKQTSDKEIVAGWWGGYGEIVLNSGELTGNGIYLRSVGARESELFERREAFIMNGGVLNLGNKGLITAKGSSYTPLFYLNGGVLNSMADWGLCSYATVSFGRPLEQEKDGQFTLNLAGHTVDFNGVLQGGAEVTLTGDGTFRNDPGPQSIVDGSWKIENRGENILKGAAGWQGDLTLAPNVSASLKIYAPSNYVAAGTYSTHDHNFSYVADQLHDSKVMVGYPWFSGRMHDELLRRAAPQDNVFSYAGEFYVDEEKSGIWTFACTYHYILKLSIDGELVCSNADPQNVSEPGMVELNAGWHSFKLSAQNLWESDVAGPVVDDWKNNHISIGFHVGQTDSVSAADYTRFDTDTLRMRPTTSNLLLHKRISGVKSRDGWETRTDYDKAEYFNSLAVLSSKGHNDGYGWWEADHAINDFSGYVWLEESGTWTFWGEYRGQLLLDLDGQRILTTEKDQSIQVDHDLDAGWHAIHIRFVDTDGWIGPINSRKILYFMRPSDNKGWYDHAIFEEGNFRFVASTNAPAVGKMGGLLTLQEGSHLKNDADTPASITGTLAGTGTLEGLFRMDGGTYALTGSFDRRELTGVSFGDDIFPDVLKDTGTVAVRFDQKPCLNWYKIGPAMGLDPEKSQASISVTYPADDGTIEDMGDSFGLAFDRNGELLLVNRCPPVTIIILK